MMTSMKNMLSLSSYTSVSNTSINNRKRILIDEFLASSDDRLKEFQFEDHAIEAILDCLEHPERDIELFKSITKRLYEIYRTQDRQLRLLTLIFLPTLIGVYLRYHHLNSSFCKQVSTNLILENKSDPESVEKDDELSRKNLRNEPNASIAILLLCVYNFEIINQKTGDLKTMEVRMITLSKPSIYHEPNSHSSFQTTTIPTEQMLAKINNPNDCRITIFGPYNEVEQLNTGNQFSVFTVLMKLYNQHIQDVGYYSMQSVCRLYTELLRQGSQIDLKSKVKTILQSNDINFDGNVSSNNYSITPDVLQISFTSEFLTEIMKSGYSCFYSDLEDLALDLIEEISKRATFKFYADVILMVNSFKNTQAIINRDREDHVAKMKKMNQSQISLNATAHVASMSSISTRKAAITNASFKTRKLPDDIPIVTTTVTGTTPQAHLTTQSMHHLSAKQQRLINQMHSKQNGQHLQFKNLDSINEESSPSISSMKNQHQQQQNLANHQSNSKLVSSNHVSSASKPSRKSVINMLKELKDKPKKSSKSSLSSSEVNGKLNTHIDETIPMKHLTKNAKKFIDDDESSDTDNPANNVPLAALDDDDDNADEYDKDNLDPLQTERIKLRIEISDVSDVASSNRSSGASDIALLNKDQQVSGSQAPVITSKTNSLH